MAEVIARANKTRALKKSSTGVLDGRHARPRRGYPARGPQWFRFVLVFSKESSALSFVPQAQPPWRHERTLTFARSIGYASAQFFQRAQQ
jgi:hypothetical protein